MIHWGDIFVYLGKKIEMTRFFSGIDLNQVVNKILSLQKRIGKILEKLVERGLKKLARRIASALF